MKGSGTQQLTLCLGQFTRVRTHTGAGSLSLFFRLFYFYGLITVGMIWGDIQHIYGHRDTFVESVLSFLLYMSSGTRLQVCAAISLVSLFLLTSAFHKTVRYIARRVHGYKHRFFTSSLIR